MLDTKAITQLIGAIIFAGRSNFAIPINTNAIGSDARKNSNIKTSLSSKKFFEHKLRD